MTGRLPPAADGVVDPHMSAAIARADERAATRITAPVTVAAPGRATGNRIVLETGVTLATGASAKAANG
jgi:hypothetical protein